MKIDYTEPYTGENERQHDWLQQYSIYVKHSTGQLEHDSQPEYGEYGETKIAVWRCRYCGQTWRHP